MSPAALLPDFTAHRGARVPRGGRPAPGKLRPARGVPPGAHKFPPHPRAGGRAPLPPSQAPPLVPPSGHSRQLPLLPAPAPRSSAPSRRPRLAAAPAPARQPPKLSRLPQSSLLLGPWTPPRSWAGACRWNLSGPRRRALTSGIPAAPEPGSCGKGG